MSEFGNFLMGLKAYDANKHPHKPKGDAHGGEFAPKGAAPAPVAMSREEAIAHLTEIAPKYEFAPTDRKDTFMQESSGDDQYGPWKTRRKVFYDPGTRKFTATVHSSYVTPFGPSSAGSERGSFYSPAEAFEIFKVKPAWTQKAFDPSAHPRGVKGQPTGGKFVPKTGAAPVAASATGLGPAGRGMPEGAKPYTPEAGAVGDLPTLYGQYITEHAGQKPTIGQFHSQVTSKLEHNANMDKKLSNAKADAAKWHQRLLDTLGKAKPALSKPATGLSKDSPAKAIDTGGAQAPTKRAMAGSAAHGPADGGNADGPLGPTPDQKVEQAEVAAGLHDSRTPPTPQGRKARVAQLRQMIVSLGEKPLPPQPIAAKEAALDALAEALDDGQTIVDRQFYDFLLHEGFTEKGMFDLYKPATPGAPHANPFALHRPVTPGAPATNPFALHRPVAPAVAPAGGSFDETKHPRGGKGTAVGGEFVPKAGGPGPVGGRFPLEMGGGYQVNAKIPRELVMGNTRTAADTEHPGADFYPIYHTKTQQHAGYVSRNTQGIHGWDYLGQHMGAYKTMEDAANAVIKTHALKPKQPKPVVVATSTKAFDESEHPRKPKGEPGGGMFAPKDYLSAPAAAPAPAAKPEQDTVPPGYYWPSDGMAVQNFFKAHKVPLTFVDTARDFVLSMTAQSNMGANEVGFHSLWKPVSVDKEFPLSGKFVIERLKDSKRFGLFLTPSKDVMKRKWKSEEVKGKATKDFEESKHPRAPEGEHNGGQFVSLHAPAAYGHDKFEPHYFPVGTPVFNPTTGKDYEVAAAPAGGSTALHLRDVATGAVSAVEPGANPPFRRRWVDHVPGLPEDTNVASRDASGNLTPEREKLHEAIVNHFMDGHKSVPEGEQPTIIFTMGGPASGKGAFSKYYAKTLDAVVADADAVREFLPEYEHSILKNAVDAAKITHKESSVLAYDELLNAAIKKRMNVVYDGTGNNPDKYVKKIAEVRKLGYRVLLRMSYLDMESGMSRLMARAEERGRLVPEDVVKSTYESVYNHLGKVAKAADDWQVYDNRGREAKLAWSGGMGMNPTAHEPEFVKFYEAKHGNQFE